MATTTTNFGWDIPQSTDLVKDGATAIAALGQDIDTSMVDLKGGTTGQILSKTSNTDMDFTWVTPNPGDITGVTAGTGITGGGTSGDVTVSFDIANYGGGQYAAGKNKIINGDFGIWQRGTSFSNPATVTYTSDRWVVAYNGTGATRTISRQAFTAGTAPVAGYESQYFLRFNTSVAGTETQQYLYQPIEDVRTFAGKTITISYWAKADAGRTVTVRLAQNFGSGGSATVLTTGSGNTITTSWARYSETIAVPSISGKTIGTSSYLSAEFLLGNSPSTFTFDIWGVQVEAGSTATPFQTATGTIQGELAACQRYYVRFTPNTTGTLFSVGTAETTTLVHFPVPLPVAMRTYPTADLGTTLRVFQGATSYSSGTFAVDSAGHTNMAQITYTHGSAVFTAGYSQTLNANTATSSGYIGFTAEL